MQPRSHETLIANQFGPRAQAYVVSPVHAHGEDLDRLAALARELAPGAVLDLGCGGGHVPFALARHAAAVSAYDLSEEMLEAVRGVVAERGLGNVRTVRGVAEQLPFADATFDLVVTRFSAHHWNDAGAGVREAARVLKCGGRAVFIDIASSEVPVLDTHLQAIEVLRDPSHVRDYAPSEWRALVGGAGLTILAERTHRLRLEFASWVERIGTPALHVAAIRSLQSSASREVVRAFEIDEHGSFTSEVIWLEAVRER